MQMIDVLKRLAELDASNPNVDSTAMIQSKPLATVTNMEIVKEGDARLPQFQEPDLADLKALSGVKKIDECGMMGSSSSPASLNVTAGSGEELSGLLKDLMGLAGVDKSPMPMAHNHGDEEPLVGRPEMDDKMVMRAMLDSMNEQPAEEGILGGAIGAGLGALAGGPMGAMTGYSAGSKFGDDLDDEDEDDRKRESYDNTPAKSTDIPPSQEGAREYNPNTGDHRERQAGLARAMPMEELEASLMKQLKEFMAEASGS